MLKNAVCQLISRMDVSRVSLEFINILESLGLFEMALKFATKQYCPMVTPGQRFDLSLRAMKFAEAFDVISPLVKEKMEQGELYGTPIYEKLKRLSHLCLVFGQWEVLPKCFELTNDRTALSRVYALIKNKSLSTSLQKIAVNAIAKV